MNLNGRSQRLVDELLARAEERKVAAHAIEGGSSSTAGSTLQEACWPVSTWPESAWPTWRRWPSSRVKWPEGIALGCRWSPITPCSPCLASQYAGWAVSEEKFFAMGSGPMRAAKGDEPIFAKIAGARSRAESIVGVLEGRKKPTPAVVAKIAAACRVAASEVTLLIAPTASLAGGADRGAFGGNRVAQACRSSIST